MNAAHALVKYDVRIGATLVNVVYRVARDPAKDVRRGLIDHDGMPATISVYRFAALGRYAYDDVARYSKPKEC